MQVYITRVVAFKLALPLIYKGDDSFVTSERMISTSMTAMTWGSTGLETRYYWPGMSDDTQSYVS